MIAFMYSQLPSGTPAPPSPEPLSITSFKRASDTSYQIEGSGSGILYIKNIDTDAVTQEQITLPFTLNHAAGERFEVSTDQTNWIFDNEIRYVQLWASGRDFRQPKYFGFRESKALLSGNNLALNKPVITVNGSSIVGNYVLSNLTDGDGGSTAFIYLENRAKDAFQIDLGSVQEVEQVTVFVSTTLIPTLNFKIKVGKTLDNMISIYSTPRLESTTTEYFNVKI